MFDDVPKASRISLEFTAEVQFKLLPYIRNQRRLRADLSSVIEDKGDEHFAYRIDEYANRILFDMLEKYGLNCQVFSEETGWSTHGGQPQYYVICDPYCNSSLTMRGFRESAAAICITDMEGELVSCAICDLQIDRIFYADRTGAYLWELDEKRQWLPTQLSVSEIQKLKDAFVVVSLLKLDRRKMLAHESLFQTAKIIHGVDGAIMIGRLAAGDIDAYLDPFKGQPLYEMPCFEIVLRAGGIVTDVEGTPFRLSNIINRLAENPKDRFQVVAAGNAQLHREILKTFGS
ncbi:MAG: monophosphatase [Pyrinomonadaceae bacterium]|nr:monophosphatase [Pyrinomonadaceae bacterium]